MAATEQEWMLRYLTNNPTPFPVVLGTRKTWGVRDRKGKLVPSVVLLSGSWLDLSALADVFEVSFRDYRRMRINGLCYHAISITDKEKVKFILKEFDED